MELYAKDMVFYGDSEKEKLYDYCIHGKIVFKIGDVLLSDDTEWCVSASAYRFLHTLFENHFIGTEDFLIPCCGHTLIPSDDKKSVIIPGCGNGIDFNVIHEQERVAVVTAENTDCTVPFADYKSAVISFAEQVMDFYKFNPPREFEEDFDRDGFRAFVTEWYSLYDKVVAIGDEDSTANPIDFEDYDVCTEDEIMDISKEGILLKSFRFINFRECAYNFKLMCGGSGKCIGEREITDLSFTFYTSPKPIMIEFVEKSKLVEFVAKENTISRFHKLQKEIEQYGYSTRDMS